MRKVYENFHILHFQKRIVSAEIICGNTVSVLDVRITSDTIRCFSYHQTVLLSRKSPDQKRCPTFSHGEQICK